MTSDARRIRFRQLHDGPGTFVMPNPWDAGSARLLASAGFVALATTSAGFAWSLGRLDQQVTRAELVAHTGALAAATELPLNVDAERCFSDDLPGIAQTVRELTDAGAAGLSIEDFDPATGALDDTATAAARVRAAVDAAYSVAGAPLVVTARAENHLYGVTDLDDTVARLVAYRDAGADVLYAPGLTGLRDITALVRAVEAPVNVLALPDGPSVPDLAAAGVRRVSTGASLAAAAYGALMVGARELLGPGTSAYARSRPSGADFTAAFSSPDERR
jgi:2-methylisocitrate lyase-like PEP mutase family enzyme